MGKSPGKWIKTVLFGKKTPKSTFVKGMEKAANEKEGVHVGARAHENAKEVNHLEVSSGGLTAIDINEQDLSSEYKESSAQLELGVSAVDDQSGDVEQTREVDVVADAERIAQENAATQAQAAFRGYLARRAFKALKGIIRLQALIRGHLVRRQAVASLYCIVGIVKLQALVRGSMIRCSDAVLEVQKVCLVKNLDGISGFEGNGASTCTMSLSANTFIRRLLAPTPAGLPLRIQYDVTDPNSVEIWLERWSILCPWKPVSPPKKVTNSKGQKKQGNSIDGEAGRPKRSVRKVPSLFENASAQSTSELEKPRRNPKKVLSHSAESLQENPQYELEKVKRSLRKVHYPVTESSVQTKVPETPAQSQGKSLSSNILEVSTPNEVNPDVSLREETSVIVKKEFAPLSEAKDQDQDQDQKPSIEELSIQKALETNLYLESSNNEKTKGKPESFESNEKDENTPVSNIETVDSTLTENQKSSRRASFPTKPEHVDEALQNSPKLPSYMQATQSAKAKLRAQGSPKNVQDTPEKNNVTRRHSLPSSANGKASSVSPRIQKPLQGSGKSGNKNDKSLLSSRDGSALAGKGSHTQWRR